MTTIQLKIVLILKSISSKILCEILRLSCQWFLTMLIVDKVFPHSLRCQLLRVRAIAAWYVRLLIAWRSPLNC